jgi:hypothetical protein
MGLTRDGYNSEEYLKSKINKLNISQKISKSIYHESKLQFNFVVISMLYCKHIQINNP